MAMVIAQAFPRHPDGVAIINALAEDAGEPSVDALRAAAVSNKQPQGT